MEIICKTYPGRGYLQSGSDIGRRNIRGKFRWIDRSTLKGRIEREKHQQSGQSLALHSIHLPLYHPFFMHRNPPPCVILFLHLFTPVHTPSYSPSTPKRIRLTILHLREANSHYTTPEPLNQLARVINEL